MSTFMLRLIHFPPRLLYALGLDALMGRLVLLLTTTGRKSGLPRVTPLQYEQVDGTIYVASVRGEKADWVRNIKANPQVRAQIRARQCQGTAEIITDPARIADFLELRLRRHPRMIGTIVRMDGLSAHPSRAQLEEYAARLALVAITTV